MASIACALTTDQVEAEDKDVTRRWAWKRVKPGDFLRVVNKIRIPPSQPPQRTLACVEVVRVDRVLRQDIAHLRYDEDATAFDYAYLSVKYWEQRNEWDREVAREGFPGMTVDAFIDVLVKMAPAIPEVLTRIEWRYRRDLLQIWHEIHPPHDERKDASPLQAFFSFDEDDQT